MRIFVLLFVAFLFCAVPPPSLAQDFSEEELENELSIVDDDAPVSAKTAAAYLDRCLARVPRRFTPSAHEEYCVCTGALMRQNITNADLEALNANGAKKPGNPAFEKFVNDVMMPCMEGPIVDIAYVECIEDRSNSPLIYHIPKYCQCVGTSLVPFVKQAGVSTAMVNMARHPDEFREPIDALLRSTPFIQQKNQAYTACKRRYMKTQLPNVRAYP